MDDTSQGSFAKEVTDILKERLDFISRNYPQVRAAHQESYYWPQLDSLRHEVTLCLIFGLHQAATTLTNHMLESLLKIALTIHYANKNSSQAQTTQKTVESFISFFRSARKEFGGNELGDSINRACTAGLITKEQKTELHKYREIFRNAYSHSDKDKTFGDEHISAQAIHLESGNFAVEQPESARLADLIIHHGLGQAMQAEQDAIPYFLYIDKVTREIRERLFGPTSEYIKNVFEQTPPKNP